MREKKKSRRSNGAGYTYRVGNSWKTVIEVNGQRITATNKNQQESRRLAKEKAMRVSNLNRGSAFGANKVKLSDHLIPWLENIHRNHIAHSTYRRYAGISRNYVMPALGELPIQKITKKELQQFMNSLAAAKVGPRTRNQALALLSACFQGGIDAGLIDVNPATGIKKAVETQKQINPLNELEVETLLSSSTGTFMHARLHLAFMGLRQGEVLGLKWNNVDLDKGVITLEEQAQKVDGKTMFVRLKSQMSHRSLYLGDGTLDALRKHKAIVARMRLEAGENWQDLNLVFPNRKGGFLQQKVDYSRWIRALSSCNIPIRRLHDARHTAGTLLFAHGEGIETIRRFLGHSTVNLTSKTYVHNADAPMKSAAQTLNKVLGKVDIA